MKLKIKSDGTGRGTFITNAETGEPIENVTAIKLQCTEPDGLWIARLKFTSIEFEVEAKEE